MRSRVIAVVFFAALFVMGCHRGPKLGKVSGVITLDGQPIEKATITFTPAQGQMSFARTDADGFFRLQFADGRPGAVLGDNVVSIETYRIDVDELDNVVEHKEVLPPKYNSESELTRTVVPGDNLFDFELTEN